MAEITQKPAIRLAENRMAGVREQGIFDGKGE
jgi:hypothetical protein